MSALGRAAGRFEGAFTALPKQTRDAVALAMWRAAPAMAQYQKDLQVIGESPELVEAIWDLLIAAAARIAFGGKDGIKQKHLDEMAARAPETHDFLIRVSQAITAGLPGGGGPRALPPAPALIAAADPEAKP